MSRLLVGMASMAIIISACAASRKISSVGLREISSVAPAQKVSERRLRLAETKKFAKDCPQGLVDFLPALTLEDIEFPACPDSLVQNYHDALQLLKGDERTALEEAINSQCRSMGSSIDGTSIDLIFPREELRNLAARYSEGTAEARILGATREGIIALIEHHLPLDRWAQQNGQFLLSEEMVASLERIVLKRGCRLTDEEVDASFHTIRRLEDLSRILVEGPQKQELSKLLHAIYAMQDRKIEEFFRP